MTMARDFQFIFERLREILKPYTPHLTLTKDTDETYYLEGHFS